MISLMPFAHAGSNTSGYKLERVLNNKVEFTKEISDFDECMVSLVINSIDYMESLKKRSKKDFLVIFTQKNGEVQGKVYKGSLRDLSKFNKNRLNYAYDYLNDKKEISLHVVESGHTLGSPLELPNSAKELVKGTSMGTYHCKAK